MGSQGEPIQTVDEAYRHGATKWEATRDPDNNGWAGLLPGTEGAYGLDTRMRAELIKYGEFAQATYDGFDKPNMSPTTQNAKDFLPEAAPASWSKISQRYEIPSEECLIYAKTKKTLLCKCRGLFGRKVPDKSWIGYIAITSDEEMKRGKEIVVAFRGTILTSEWLVDGRIFDNDYANIIKDYKIKRRADAPTLKPEETMRKCVNQLVKDNKGDVKRVTFVGHSLGGALATIAAADIGVMKRYDEDFGENENWNGVSLAAFTFAAPRVASWPFHQMLRSLNVPVLNVVNYGDVVPCVPAGNKGTNLLTNIMGPLTLYTHTIISGVGVQSPRVYWASFAEATRTNTEGLIYTDSGTNLFLDSDATPNFIRPLGKYFAWAAHHNLEGYLFMLATQHTSHVDPNINTPFFRDYALLNKSDDLLKQDIAAAQRIPTAWYGQADMVPETMPNGNIIWRRNP